MDGDGPITIIRVPPDNCTNCHREHVTAYETQPGGTLHHNTWHPTLTGLYQCPDCNYVWDTTWRIEPR